MAKKSVAAKTTKPNSRLVTSQGEVVVSNSTETVETPKGESRGHYAESVVYGLSQDQIDAAIAAESIRSVGNTAVVIRGKGNVKDEFVTYDKLIALNFDGAKLLCGGKEVVATDKPETGEDTRSDAEKLKGAADHFNYGFDLEVKRELRAKLAELIEGPAKAIAKAAQTMLDQGVAETIEDAVAMVKAGRLRKGLPV
jgi:hypothetical protein